MEGETLITKDVVISAILRAYPQTQVVLIAHGMGCAGCMGSLDESLESGARLHGISLAHLLSDLNRAIGAEAT